MHKKLLLSLTLASSLSARYTATIDLTVPPEKAIQRAQAAFEKETGILVQPQINVNTPKKLASVCSDINGTSGSLVTFFLKNASRDNNGIILKSDGTPITQQEIQEALAVITDDEAVSEPACRVIKKFLEAQAKLLAAHAQP